MAWWMGVEHAWLGGDGSCQLSCKPQRLRSGGRGRERERKGENAMLRGSRATRLISPGFLSSPGCGVITSETKAPRRLQRP